MTLPPGQFWCHNMEVVGYSDLQERPGFKLALQEVEGRWYLYVAHFWHSGWSILEVTDPAAPRLVRFLPGPTNTSTGQIQVADGLMITGLEKFIPGWGDDPNNPNFETGVMIWDIKDPENPELLSHFPTGGTGTHRNFYDGGRYVHLAAGVEGFTGNIYLILDIDDPADPKEVGRWWYPGQWQEGGEAGAPPDTSLHGGAYVAGSRVSLPYGGSGLVVLDISDVAAPQLVGQMGFSPPFPSFIAVHTAVPLQGSELVAVNSEAIQEDCNEPVGFVGLVRISGDEPFRLISMFPFPSPPAGAPFENFCQRGGRFGPHNQHQPQNQKALLQNEDFIYLTFFNAGLRVFDIRDPLLPKEAGYFVPPDPEHRLGPLPKTLAAQSEDVLVDARGYAYVSDKNHGIYIVRYTGA